MMRRHQVEVISRAAASRAIAPSKKAAITQTR
jgi:hypothetical protein